MADFFFVASICTFIDKSGCEYIFSFIYYTITFISIKEAYISLLGMIPWIQNDIIVGNDYVIL